MTRGFLTIATGDFRYYKMAHYLLQSYRLFSDDPMPFAIICDEENAITREFDEVVLVKKAYHSFLDKIELTVLAPFDENVFIDADCLAYQNLNIYWQLFQDADDFSSIGEAHDLSSGEKGWFTKEGAGPLSNQIRFITHLHGGIYFIRKGEQCRKLNELCHYIIDHYKEFTFSMFNDQPADEPVFALAMAVLGMKPRPYPPEYCCFYPTVTFFDADISKGRLIFSTPWVKGKIKNGYLCHWANANIGKAVYKREVYRLNARINGRQVNSAILGFLNLKWNLQYFISRSFARVKRKLKR